MKAIKKIYTLIHCMLMLPHIVIYYIHPMRKIIREDVAVNYQSTSGLFGFIHVLVHEKTFRNLFYHRIGMIHWLFSWMLPREKTLTLGHDVPLGARAKFTHCHTTYLNVNSIGDDFECLHLVTIGANKGGKPTIGNNVKVYCGAMILGNVKVGNNVSIGAGSVVTRDVPDNCTIIGNPARIVRINGEKVDIPLGQFKS